MADHKPLYRWSLQDAVTHNEVQDWRDSYRENCDCARAIERAIADQYHDNILENGTKDIIDRYGFDRVNWVLANTLQEKAHDGRFSQENKRWAKGFYIPRDDVRWHFCVESHPGLTDLFVNQAREALSPDALNTTKPSSTSCSALTQNSLSTVPGAGSLPPLQM